MAGIEEKYKKFCKTDTPPTAKNNGVADYPISNDTSTLQDYLALNAFQYNGLGGIIAARTAAGAVVDPTDHHMQQIWLTIASELVNRYHGDRTGKAYPKGDGGANFNVGIPPLGHITPGGPGTGVLNGDKKFGDTVDLIVKWFKANWIEGQEDGIKTKSPTRSSPVACKAVTKSGAKSEAAKVQGKFDKYWKGKQFGVGGGVALPASLRPTDRSMKYFPNLAPHKDAEYKQEESGTSTEREGPIGFCIGPVNRSVEPEEIEGETTQLKDGNKVYEVPVFRVPREPQDKNPNLVDSTLYLSQISSIPGYAAFRAINPEFTELPIDGKELKIPIFPSDPDAIQFDDDGNPIPLREVSADPKAYNLGINASGKLGQGPTYTGAKTNPGYGEKVTGDALASYGAITCTEFPWNNAAGGGIVDQWMIANNNQVLKGSTIGAAWGASGPSEKIFPGALIQFFQPKLKVSNPSNDLSYSDPRNWGPYTENTQFKAPNSDIGTGGTEVVDGKQVTYTVQYKYVIPDLSAMKNAAESEGANTLKPGVPAHRTKACYPEMNKQYWGLRLAEVYPPPLDPFAEAAKAPTGGANAAVVPGTGGVKKGTLYVAGPAPPFTIKESGSPAMNLTFEFLNGNFFKGDPTKAMASQKSFTREAPNASANKSWIQSWPKYMSKVIKYDSKVKGKASGGMTYFDAAKQIIPPYAPPPLKPVLPNSKKFTFSGVK